MPSLEEDIDGTPAGTEFWTIPHATVCRTVEALYLARLYQRRMQHVTEREVALVQSAIADLEEFSNHTTT